jgi:hypothetical protein
LPPDAVPPEIRLALRARTEQAAGDHATAAAIGDEAAQAVTNESRPDDVRRLAIMLQNMGKAEKALPLWRRIVPPGRLTTDTRYLLRCADRCGEEDVIIDVCADLRRSGHVDRECLDLEIAALGRRSPQRAAALIQDLIGGVADDSIKRFLRLRLSHIGLYAKQPALVESDPDLLPAVDEVNVKTGRAVVGVLVQSGAATAAVAYAYELYRRFQDDFDAHMAVVESFGLIGGGRDPKIKKPDVVRPGSAICFQPSGTRKREWWIIEDGPNPSLARGERAVDDPVVQRMLGKRKGESFVLRADPLPVEARITKIEDKYVFRWRDCMSGMETRFSQKTPIWTINVRRGGGKYDFTEFFRQLDQHAQKAKERDEWYRDHPVPLSMFADAAGKSVLEAAMYVAGKPELPFRCCNGSLPEIEASTEAMKNCARLVIDGSALSTLFLSGSSGWLGKVPAECVVTEHSLYEFRRMDLLSRPADQELIHAGKVGDQYVHEVWKPERLRPLRERIEQLIQDIEARCTIVPGVSLAPLLPEHRKVLVEACGRDVAESIVTAAEPATLLWTDDRTVSDLAVFSLKVRRTWTQAVFEWLWSEGIAGDDVRDRLAVDLVAAGYYWTRLTPGAVLLAGAEAGWEVENPRFAATLLDSHPLMPSHGAYLCFWRACSRECGSAVCPRTKRTL